jgi:manganese oxidase
VIAKGGFPLPEPYQVDTLNVAPGERYTVLVRPTDEQSGVWAYDCHILNTPRATKGCSGW